MNEVEVVIVAFATIFGAITSGWLGWLESGEPFDTRKFIATMLRGILMSLVEFVGISSLLPDMQLTVITLITAFLIGAGFDVLLKRGQGVIEAKPSPSTNIPTTNKDIQM